MACYTWQESLDLERSKYKPHLTGSQKGLRMGEYSQNQYENLKLFGKTLANLRVKRILDFGSSEDPLFSYACSDAGIKTVAYDFLSPGFPDMLKNKEVEFIQDDVNNIEKYELGKFDLIFCRHLSPAQCLIDWYDPKFKSIWVKLLSMLEKRGVIYWVQMSNATGIPGDFFSNNTKPYYTTFFKELGMQSKITKYGYMSFKVARKLDKKWSKFEIKSNNKKHELQDKRDLIKNYALQLQPFFENVSQKEEIMIKGRKIEASMIKALLEDNFLFKNVKVIEMDQDVMVNDFEIENKGYHHDEFFLTDESNDKRFTDEFLQVSSRYY